ncbi:MAG: MaoC family dehydratase [Candidatus Pacearchaeota archaeon]
MEILANENSWLQYADAIGDKNPIHRSAKAAKGFGLEGVVAPGMWLASHAQRDGEFVRANFGFRLPVYKDTMVEMTVNGSAYSFSNGKTVADGNAIRSEYPEAPDVKHNFDFVYSAQITNNLVKQFLKSIGAERVGTEGLTEIPSAFLMSMSAPALLKFGEDSNCIKVHGFQTFIQYRRAIMGDIDVELKVIKSGSRGLKLNNYWLQEGKLIASGNSMILTYKQPTLP